MKDLRQSLNLAFLGIALMGMLTVGAAVARASEGGNEQPAGDGKALLVTERAAAMYAIAATMGLACLSAAYAVGKVGAAALGAAAEKPELLNKALPFVGLGEGIAVLGMLISFLIWMKL